MLTSPDMYVGKLITAGLLKKIVILILAELFSELIRAIRDNHIEGFFLYSATASLFLLNII